MYDSVLKEGNSSRQDARWNCDWNTWEQSEWKQLSSYQKQHMFGDHILRPPPKNHKDGNLKHPTVLPFVWTYLLKDGNTPKARGTCNGGKR